ELLARPTRDVRRYPAEIFRLFVKGGGVMANVACGKQIALGNRLDGFANHHAVHEDRITGGEILNGEFVFCGNAGAKRVGGAREGDGVALREILQSDENVVACVELQDFRVHRLRLSGGSGTKPLLQKY